MEQYVFWVITLIGGAILMTPFGILIWYVRGTMEENKESRKMITELREDFITMNGRITVAETNHSHLDESVKKLDGTLRELINELKYIGREVAKKKDLE